MQVLFDIDENVRGEVQLDRLAGMMLVFQANGTGTADNASSLNDGAAALVLATQDAVQRQRLTPLARLVSYAHSGVHPDYMGMGPVPATRTALKRAGLRIEDIDVIDPTRHSLRRPVQSPSS